MSSVGDAQQIVPVSTAPLAPRELEAPGPAVPEAGLTFADFWRVLRQRKLLIIVSFFVFYALVGAATGIVWRWFPAYRSTAILQLRPPVEDAFGPIDRLVQPAMMETVLATEAAKIRRLDVLQDVLSQPEIQETEFFKWYDDFDECLYDLEWYLGVGPIRDTTLIRVTLAIRRRDEARLIVDTVVNRYVERYTRDTQDKGRKAYEDLKGTRDEVEKELLAKQRELREFRSATDVGALESESDTLVRSLADQNYVVNTYDARAADLQAQLDSIEGIAPDSLPVSPEDRVIVEADPILRLYRQNVESLDVDIKAARENSLGEEHRYMKQLKIRRQGFYELEAARREELLDDLRERKVDSLRQELARVRSVQQRSQDQLEGMQRRLDDLDGARVRYEAMLKDEERLQHNLEVLDEKVIETKHIFEAAPRAPRISIEQSAKEAVEPSRPNWKLWLGGGVLLALAGAVGLAFLREITDKAVRTPVDVARHGHLSVLGCIPQLDDEEADIDEIELATRQAPQSLVAEAFRQVRANLVFSGPIESQRVLLVTSPSPGNGKTAVAINMAVTLAQSNQRVLLIDCNFRQPAIRAAFAGTRPEGLSNILIGQATLNDLVTSTDIPNLDVLTSGPMPPTPAELLSAGSVPGMLAQAKERWDRVILDGPPVLLISDALVVATQVDGVIIVARAVENSKGVLRRTREQLDKVGAHVVGAVLNGVQARAGGYYREQYREFYDYTYTSDETVPRELPGVPLPDSDDVFPDEDESEK